jgi:hypothetical protein
MLGMLLAVLGIFALVYQGVSYTHREKLFDVGPIHATRDDTERIPLPRSSEGWLYWAALLCSSSARDRRRNKTARSC